MNDAIIHVENFQKKYGEYVAVEDVSFQVYQGEIFGLLGPNGAGKTSILESLEGLRQASDGKIRVEDLDPYVDQRKLRNTIGVQLQSAGMPESITPREAMKLFCAYHQVPPRFDLIDRLGIAEKQNTQFYQLSAGQQRRLALALAVAHQPKILFLDEPTAGLDVHSRNELHTLMHELKSGSTTIVLATHDMAEAEEISDRVAILLKGKLATVGTPMQITATGAGLTKISVNTQNRCFATLEEELAAVQSHQTKDEYDIFFSSDIASSVMAIIEYIDANRDVIIDLRVERPSLEDRFLEITRAS